MKDFKMICRNIKIVKNFRGMRKFHNKVLFRRSDLQMIIESTRFGQLNVSDEDVINFQQGLGGFPDEKSFVLIPHKPDSSFVFMQSVTEPNLTFIMLETFSVLKEYEFKLNDQVVKELNLSTDNPPQVLNIVTAPEKVEDMTVNLLAPIVINVKNSLAQQVILEDVAYKTRHRIFNEGISQMMK